MALLPSEYTQIEYIQSSGTQYINTGVNPDQDTRVVVDYKEDTLLSGNACLFGARERSNENAFSVWFGPDSVIGMQYGSVGWNFYSIVADYSKKLHYDYNKNILSVTDSSGTTQTATAAQTTINPGVPLVLFSVSTDGSIDSRRSSGRLYGCQIYDNGPLVRDFVPCINPSGAVGLYDQVGAQFYSNAGTGAFEAGPEVAQPNVYVKIDNIWQPVTGVYTKTNNTW